MSSPLIRGKHVVRKTTDRSEHPQFHEQAQGHRP